MQKLSIVIITHNEEKRIRTTLESAKWCDEIVVVDSGSTDKTVDICKEYSNCTIYTQAFLGYGPQKKFAVDKASNDWVMSVDADEIITEGLLNEITEILSRPTITEAGFNVPITLIFMEKIFKYGTENKFPHLRLFNKTKGNFNDLKVHEGVNIDGTISTLKNEMLHCSYFDIHHYLEKFNQYTTIYKNEAVKKGKKAKKWSMIIRFPFDFIKHYFFSCNFMNGYPGFVWAVFCSFYVFVKYNKLYEANLKK
jgi:glycosyltransferase involved in cell wall biosynthesis